MAKRLKPTQFRVIVESLTRIFDGNRPSNSPVDIAKDAGIFLPFNSGEEIYTYWDRVVATAEEEDKVLKLVEVAKKRAKVNMIDRLYNAVCSPAAFMEDELVAETKFISANKQKDETIKIFLNYDKADVKYKENLVNYISVYCSDFSLNNSSKIELFDINLIPAGQVKSEAINNALLSADVLLLFVSIHFLQKEQGFCYTLTAKARDRGKFIIPIYVRTGAYGQIKYISDIVPLPADGIPLAVKESQGEDMDTVYSEMAISIINTIKNI